MNKHQFGRRSDEVGSCGRIRKGWHRGYCPAHATRTLAGRRVSTGTRQELEGKVCSNRSDSKVHSWDQERRRYSQPKQTKVKAQRSSQMKVWKRLCVTAKNVIKIFKVKRYTVVYVRTGSITVSCSWPYRECVGNFFFSVVGGVSTGSTGAGWTTWPFVP